MSKIEDSVVDMYEQLPVPFGLVRFGVAPDHPEVKVELRLHVNELGANSVGRIARRNSKKLQSRHALILLGTSPLGTMKDNYP